MSNATIEIKVLANPFNAGDKVIIPSGAKFTSMNPNSIHPNEDGVLESSRKQTVTVAHTGLGWVDLFYTGHQAPALGELIEHKNVATRVMHPTIVYAGALGYWKTVELSEEILEANGKPVEYSVLGEVDAVVGSYRQK